MLKAESDAMLHLDVLRFVSSCGIVLHHSLEFWFPADVRGRVLGYTQNLALFVDLFFVISGFVITYVYSGRIGNGADFGRFMQRRIGRLVPLHLATMFAAIVLAATVLAAGLPYPTAPAFTGRCIASTALLVHAIFPCGGIPFNSVNWSISVEMALYVLFPMMLFLARRSVRLAWALSGLAVLAGFAWWRDWIDIYPILRGIASFAFGMGLYFSRRQLGRLRHADLALSGMVLLLIVAMLSGASDAIVLLLVYVVVSLAVAADMRKARPMVRNLAPLGQLTYSIYMIHQLVIVVIVNALGDKLLGLSGILMVGLTLFAYSVVFLLAYLSYRFFETPCRRLIDGLPIFGSRPG